MTTHAGVRALVTGGASGIGAATVALLRARGADVVVLDRVAAGPGDDRHVRAELTRDDEVAAAVEAAAAALGGLDVVVNNAGIGAVGDVGSATDDEWFRLWDVNVVGAARVTRAALPHLRASTRAAIVNTSSVAATVGLPRRAVYSATKGALLSLTYAMAADLVADGIRVNAVAPGTADTPWVGRLLDQADDPAAARAQLEARQPIGRLVSPEEVADAIAHLCAPGASAVTGTVLHVDGGMNTLRLPAR